MYIYTRLRAYIDKLQTCAVAQALGEAPRKDSVQVVAVSCDFHLLGSIAGFAAKGVTQHSFDLQIQYARLTTSIQQCTVRGQFHGDGVAVQLSQ